MCNNAYFGLGVASAGLGRPEEARRWFALTHEAYRRFDHRVMDSFAVANELLLVNLAYYPERVAERRRLADEELNLQRRGAGAFTGEVPPLGIGRQWLRVLEGEWDEASRLMEPGRGAFDAGALTQYAGCTLGEIARNRGEPEKAWRHVYEVLPLGVSTEPGGNRFFSALATQRLAANLSLDARTSPEPGPGSRPTTAGSTGAEPCSGARKAGSSGPGTSASKETSRPHASTPKQPSSSPRSPANPWRCWPPIVSSGSWPPTRTFTRGDGTHREVAGASAGVRSPLRAGAHPDLEGPAPGRQGQSRRGPGSSGGGA